MKKNNRIQWIFNFFVLLLLSCVVYSLFSLLKTVVIKTDSNVIAAMIAGAFTIIVTIVSVILTKRMELKKNAQEKIQLEKIEVYEEFLSFWFNLLSSGNIKGKKVDDDDMKNFFWEFTPKLILWGSDDVISEYKKFREHFQKPEALADPTTNIFRFDNLLLAIRKDTGHKNKNINESDLLSLFINDIHKFKKSESIDG